MENNGYDFGLIVKELRERAKLTQKQLGNKLGVSEGMISRYENNLSEPSFDMVRSLAAIFNVSMDYLSGTEKSSSVSTVGLSQAQSDLIKELTDHFRKENGSAKPDLAAEHNLLGKIVQVMFKG